MFRHEHQLMFIKRCSELTSYSVNILTFVFAVTIESSVHVYHILPSPSADVGQRVRLLTGRTWINIALGERVWLFLPNGAKLPTFFYNWSFAVLLNISIISTRNISTQMSTLGTTGRATAALTMQPQTCTHKEEKEIRNRIFYVKWSDF